MADTQRTREELEALLVPNSTGQIGAQDLRDFLMSVYLKDEMDALIDVKIAEASAASIYNQGLASTMWTINHNLGTYPSVMVVDLAYNVVLPDIEYTSVNQVVIRFSTPMAGKAFLN